MTIDEAIEILKDGELNPCVTEDREACDMAIKALEKETSSAVVKNDLAVREFEEIAIPLDKVKQTREKIQHFINVCDSDTVAGANMKSGLGIALLEVNKLIESEDKE